MLAWLYNRNYVFFLIYFLLISLYYVQFPLASCLPGDWDFIANLALYKHLKCQIATLFMGCDCGGFNYPIKNPGISFGADYGLGVIFVFISFWGINDIWSSWLFISILYTLNSVGLFLLSKSLFKNNYVAFFAGFFFSFNQFLLGNIENPNAIFFFLFFISFYFFVEYIQTNHQKWFVASVIIGSIQVYFSPYVFFFWSIIWLSVFLYLMFLRDIKFKFYLFLFCFIVSLIIISPYLYVFVLDISIRGDYNPINSSNIWFFSLDIEDFIRSLPQYNFIENDKTLNIFFSQIRSANIGFVMWVLGLIGILIISNKKIKYILLLMVIGGFVFSLGPEIHYKSIYYAKSPTWILYNVFSLGELIRMPLRFFFIATIALSIGLAFFCKYILLKFKNGFLGVGILIFFFIIENVTFHRLKFDHDFLVQDFSWINYIQNKNEQKNVVANLPSALFSNDRREYIYVYEQFFHQQNILNGGSAFFTKERLFNDSLMKNLKISELIDLNKVNFVIYKKELFFDKKIDSLDSRMKKVFENSDKIIFKIDVLRE